MPISPKAGVLLDTARVTIGAATVVTSVVSAPGAPWVLQVLAGTIDTLDKMRCRKQQAKLLRQQIYLILEDFSRFSASVELMPIFQEINRLAGELNNLNEKLKPCTEYGNVKRFLKQRQIGEAMDSVQSQLIMWTTQFSITGMMSIQSSQQEQKLSNECEMDSTKETLHQVLENVKDIKIRLSVWSTLPLRSEYEREELLESTKLLMNDTESRREIRESPDIAREIVDIGNAEARRLDIESHMDIEDVEEFRNLLRTLIIPDSVDIIIGEITNLVFSRDSCVGQATWKGKLVAYKRFEKVDITKLDRNRRRFSREAHIWSRLKHRTVVPFYGIVADQTRERPLALLSPWQTNGNLLQYLSLAENSLDADRLGLLCDAARGLEFLHTKSIWHGNLKCANILISANGQAMIADFTFSHITGFKTDWSVAVSGSKPAESRWLAPERMEFGPPSGPSDIYSFAMVIVECITLDRPFAEHKTLLESDIVRLVTNKDSKYKRTLDARRPMRPMNAEARFWICDDLWELMRQCWVDQPERRPPISYLYTRLQRISRAHDITVSFDRDPYFKDELNNPSTAVYACLEDLHGPACCTCQLNYGLEGVIASTASE